MPFLNAQDSARVEAAVKAAEERTTGEIHVHVTAIAPPNKILERAEALFFELGLEKTAARNGVLILIAASDRRFAIWGDKGIHQAAGQPLWDEARVLLESGLKAGKPGEALVACVAAVGRALEKHFPRSDSDKNELPDGVTES